MEFKAISSVDYPIIDENGNVEYNTNISKTHLEDRSGEIITNDYYFIDWLGGDHYIICDVTSNQHGMDYAEEFDSSKLSFKYGVICLRRDEEGKVIPRAEVVVVPVIYDKISANNLKSITVYGNNGRLSYVDLDPGSEYYGKQLVPVVLEHAVPFSTQYEGFAECSVSGVTGFLPRNLIPRTELSPLDLLTKDQVCYLLTYPEAASEALQESSTRKYSKLTGETRKLRPTKD